MANRYPSCYPIDKRGFLFPQTIEQIPLIYFNPRTPPPPRQVPIYCSTKSKHMPDEDFNIDVSDQRCLSRQSSNVYKSVLPLAMQGNIQYMAPTPPPTSYSDSYDDCDEIYSDKLTHSDKQILDANLEYFMPESNRGIGAVFINESFPDRPKRPGVVKDKEYLNNIFSMMGLRFEIFLDKTRAEILAELEKLAKSGNRSHFVLCVAFSTHGDSNDTIYGSDGRNISVQTDITSIFKPVNCRALEGKPKVFIIQACRGDKIDYIGPNVYSDACEKDELVSSETDFLISYACAPEYVAFRTEREGAWFLSELYNAYKIYSEKYHFVDILTLTNQRLMLRAKNSKEFYKNIAQPSHIQSTLKKFLWFKFNRCITWIPLVNSHDLQPLDHSSICQIEGPQALRSITPPTPIFSPSEYTPVNSKENTMDSINSEVYDWNNKNRFIGTLVQEDNKHYLKFDSPMIDCLPVYRLDKGDYTGLGIIIVNHVCGRTKREGSTFDLENFKYIFHGLKLEVVVMENIKYKTFPGELSIEESIKEAIENNPEMNSLFLAISTHGEGECGLAGHDGLSIELNSILSLLRVKKLAGKPKVVIIQACRGTNSDIQVYADSVPTVATLETDLLVAYSCAHGYKAWRDDVNGSWFIVSLRKCYEKLKGRSNILELFTATTNYMLNTFEHQNPMGICYKQPAEIRCTLTALLNI